MIKARIAIFLDCLLKLAPVNGTFQSISEPHLQTYNQETKKPASEKVTLLLKVESK